MYWEIRPEPSDDAERDALLSAAELALDREAESAWWRSGLEDLGGAPPEQLGGDSGVIEP